MSILYFIYFILIIGLVIFIHELGHFISAKRGGVRIFEFSIGMGPIIHTFKRKGDETNYNLRLFPIGGYVAMAGETEDEDSKKVPKKEQLVNKSWWVRMRTMIAGVCMNFLLALLAFFIVGLMAGGSTGDVIVAGTQEGYPAEEYLKVGDEIIKMNGKTIYSYDHFQIELVVNSGKTSTFTVKHEDGTYDTYIINTKEETNSEGETEYKYGFAVTSTTEYGFLASIKYSLRKFASLTHQMLLTIGYLISGKASLSALSGPIGIYQIVASSAAAGLVNIIYLIGYLSLNVGFINILPLPAFDGGHAFFLIIEKLKGSKVDPKFESIVHTIGFILIFGLIIFVSWNDIMRLIGR